jgi:hypothetical protein
MRRQRDPDLHLVEAMLAPPPLEDARRSLEYWEGRRRALPLYKRSARREAREMSVRWEARVRAAERVRFESTLPGRVLRALGLSGLVVYRSELTKGRVLAYGWALVPPRFKLAAAGVAAVWLLIVVGMLTTVAALLH